MDEDTLTMTDAAQLRALLADAGISQAELARNLGVSTRTVSRWTAQKGRLRPSIWLAIRAIVAKKPQP